jgi:hypothetical protein
MWTMVRCLTIPVTTLQQDAAVKNVAKSKNGLILRIYPDIGKGFQAWRLLRPPRYPIQGGIYLLEGIFGESYVKGCMRCQLFLGGERGLANEKKL